VEVLAETISENYRASPRYRAGLRDDIRKDGRSIEVTEFTSSILAPTDRSWHRSRQSQARGVESIFKDFCRGLNALLRQVRSALRNTFFLRHRLALDPPGKRSESSTERQHWAEFVSLKSLV
jgi:hypothetical protein